MLRIFVLATCMLSFSPGQAVALVNPHIESDPDRCLTCHTRVIGAEEARRGDLYLARETIDAVCLTCHVKTECCKIGQDHVGLPGYIGISHPSDLDSRDIKKDSRPTKLPLQDGRITCATCHLHLRNRPRDYKLVRIVDIRETGIDWTALCRDCHTDY